MDEVETAKELRCSGCKTTHPVSAFGVNRSKRRRYQTVCRESIAKHQKTARGKAVHGKAQARQRAKRKSNGMCIGCGKNPSPAWRKCQACRDRLTDSNLGLGATTLKAFLSHVFNGIDPIFNEPIIEGHLDHDHRTGLVRGLLDQYTNRQIGQSRMDDYPSAKAKQFKTNCLLSQMRPAILDYFWQTPCRKIGIEFIVTGKLGLPEHQKNPRIEAVNARSLFMAIERWNAVNPGVHPPVRIAA